MTRCPACRLALVPTRAGGLPQACPRCGGALALSPAGRRCAAAKARIEALLGLDPTIGLDPAADPWPPFPARAVRPLNPE